MTGFSSLELAAIVVTLISGSVNILQFILSRKSRELHLADMDHIYNMGSRAKINLSESRKGIKDEDLDKGRRYMSATNSAVNAILEKCQNRTHHLARRKPYRMEPQECERPK